MTDFVLASAFRPEITDAGRIRLGAGAKRLPVPPAAIADGGKIRLGAGLKLRQIAR